MLDAPLRLILPVAYYTRGSSIALTQCRSFDRLRPDNDDDGFDLSPGYHRPSTHGGIRPQSIRRLAQISTVTDPDTGLHQAFAIDS